MLERVIECLADVVAVACHTHQSPERGVLCSFGISTYADAIELLESVGLVRITDRAGPTIWAVWVEREGPCST